MKKLLILLILGILVLGCVGKPTKTIENNTVPTPNVVTGNIDNQKENDKETQYMSIYDGPSNITNSENARMAIIPHLRELGWNGGINVLYGRPGSNNHTIVIALPFQLTKSSTDYLNQTLSNYNFIPITLNEIVENK